MNEDLDTSVYPNVAEVRQWARAKGYEMASRAGIPAPIIAAWDKEHPDRPFVRGQRFHGTPQGRYTYGCKCARCINESRRVDRARKENVRRDKGVEPGRGGRRLSPEVPTGTERPKRPEPVGYRLEKSDVLGTLRPPTDEERRAASVAVCQFATDIGDAEMLLDALGLLERA